MNAIVDSAMNPLIEKGRYCVPIDTKSVSYLRSLHVMTRTLHMT